MTKEQLQQGLDLQSKINKLISDLQNYQSTKKSLISNGNSILRDNTSKWIPIDLRFVKINLTLEDMLLVCEIKIEKIKLEIEELELEFNNIKS